MLTGVKKDYKVYSQRNKKDERHFYRAILALRMHLVNCFIKISRETTIYKV